jgi:hypothetical protein
MTADAYDYDAFLSYGPADRSEVERIASRLRDEHGLRLCFDAWRAAPGPLDVDAIDRSRAVVVFIGPNGSGPWQAEDRKQTYAYAMSSKRSIIPALLPGAFDDDVPGLLRMRVRVDLAIDADFPRLVAGIVGAWRKPIRP